MNPFHLFINQQIVTAKKISLEKSYRAIAAVIVISLTFDVLLQVMFVQRPKPGRNY